jgi:hypothetical protein
MRPLPTLLDFCAISDGGGQAVAFCVARRGRCRDARINQGFFLNLGVYTGRPAPSLF